MTLSGLDVLIRSDFEPIKGKRVGVLCHQASIAADLRHIVEHMLPHHGSLFKIVRLFGPQHGIWGHTQDNMIEWEGYEDPATGLEVVSLYGIHREPTRAMVKDLEVLVVDLQDVGARYYTFIWTMANCMKVCESHGVPMLVLDRPNPIGDAVEGPVLREGYASFVGLHPLPARHGLTIGQIAKLFAKRHYPKLGLSVLEMEGWNASMYFDESGLPWTMPSPNMPTPDTALVYPGGCLLEATNVSEGRGTTRPFEMLGSPFVDGRAMAARLNRLGLPGVHFRPITFQPTFHKYHGQVCEGVFVHATDRAAFRPVLSYVAILQDLVRAKEFEWRKPPYEYEFEKLPIDILAGNDWLRVAVEGGTPLSEVALRMDVESEPLARRTS